MRNPTITVPTSAGDLQFSYEYGEWRAIHHLLGWRGYRCENSLPELTDGQAYLVIESSPGNEPSTKQLQALAWFLAQSDAVSKTVLNAIYALYTQQLKKEAPAYLDAEMLDLVYPDVHRVDDLSRVHIYEGSKDGLPCPVPARLCRLSLVSNPCLSPRRLALRLPCSRATHCFAAPASTRTLGATEITMNAA